MEIQTIGIIGPGALGVMYGDAFMRAFGRERVCMIADAARTARYAREGVSLNGLPCDFRYVAAEDGTAVDLLLFTVKYTGLAAAIESARRFVGERTVIVSALNGVVSEGDIAAALGAQHLLYATVQGMDATKDGTNVICHGTGYVALGTQPGGADAQALHRVCEAFTRAGLRWQTPPDIRHQLWSKFMLNVGVNQVTAARRIPYGGVQQAGAAREEMRAAMVEAQRVAACEGVFLTDAEIDDWIALMDTLAPDGMTSMRQDTLHGRKTELALFAGTVRRLGRAHGVETPVNDRLYAQIRAMEP